MAWTARSMAENGVGPKGGAMLARLLHPMLRPVMRLLRLRVEQRLRALPQPVDAPHVHAHGTDPDRVLLFGSGPAVGFGVLSHDLALPGQLARQVSALTGRGVDLDVVGDPDMTAQSALGALSALNLWRYDAIVLTIGVNNAVVLTPVAVWREAVRELLEYIAEHVPHSTRVLLVAVPPLRAIDTFMRFASRLADRHARVLNTESRKISAGFEQTVFVPFAPLTGADEVRYRSASTYQRWAAYLAGPLSSELDAEPRTAASEPAADEDARQAALDELGIIDTAREPRFDRITELASQLFGTMSALTFIDHDRHWVKSGVGFDRTESPRSGSYGDIAIHSPGVYVIEDAAQDAAEDGTTYYGLRFYAGYPIESGFGERIGLLSVFSREPRTWSQAETELLRDLALQVQRELLEP